MDSVLATLGGIIYAALIVFIGAVLAPVFGALGGEIVSWFFPDTFQAVMEHLGIEDMRLWQVGAVLGFVGSFFRCHVSNGR